jgi:hypothetical protein
MATEAEIDRFRRMTDLPDNVEPWTDSYISNIIDELGFEKAVSSAWYEKAASASSLVDITESGSSRRLSQLQSQYLAMGKAAAGDTETNDGGGSYTVAIERV